MTFTFSAAPWSVLLKATSILSTVILAAVGYAAYRVVPAVGAAHGVGIGVALIPFVVVLVSVLFVVTRFELSAGELRVRRLIWFNTISLGDLKHVSKEPGLLKGSLRLVGNGGLYSFSGSFYNRRLGRFRAFLTDWRHSVVLQLQSRTIVVSPADPDAFIQALQELFPAIRNSPGSGSMLPGAPAHRGDARD